MVFFRWDRCKSRSSDPTWLTPWNPRHSSEQNRRLAVPVLSGNGRGTGRTESARNPTNANTVLEPSPSYHLLRFLLSGRLGEIASSFNPIRRKQTPGHRHRSKCLPAQAVSSFYPVPRNPFFHRSHGAGAWRRSHGDRGPSGKMDSAGGPGQRPDCFHNQSLGPRRHTWRRAPWEFGCRRHKPVAGKV